MFANNTNIMIIIITKIIMNNEWAQPWFENVERTWF